jgi:hypothetical protein
VQHWWRATRGSGSRRLAVAAARAAVQHELSALGRLERRARHRRELCPGLKGHHLAPAPAMPPARAGPGDLDEARPAIAGNVTLLGHPVVFAIVARGSVERRASGRIMRWTPPADDIDVPAWQLSNHERGRRPMQVTTVVWTFQEPASWPARKPRSGSATLCPR